MSFLTEEHLIAICLGALVFVILFDRFVFSPLGNDSKNKDKPEKTLFERYQGLLRSYPLSMNAFQAGTISSCSVIASQFIAGNNFETLNWIEVRTMCFVAMFFITPVLLAFYGQVLQKLKWGTMGKLFIDQFIFSPIFTASIIAVRFLVLGQNSIEEIPGLVIQIAPKAVMSSWSFWIPVRAFTMNFVPAHLHLLTGNLFSFVWNIIFSLLLKS